MSLAAALAPVAPLDALVVAGLVAVCTIPFRLDRPPRRAAAVVPAPLGIGRRAARPAMLYYL